MNAMDRQLAWTAAFLSSVSLTDVETFNCATHIIYHKFNCTSPYTATKTIHNVNVSNHRGEVYWKGKFSVDTRAALVSGFGLLLFTGSPHLMIDCGE